MKQKTRRYTILRIFISIIVILAVFIGTVMLIPNQKLLSANSLFHYVNKVFGGESKVSDNFEFEASIDNVFGQMSGMLVVGSGSGLQLFDKNGKEFISARYTLSNPAVTVGTKKAAIWDIGGKDIGIVDNAGNIQDMTAEGALISVSMNQNDWVSVTSEEAGYKGAVTVYNKDLSAVYKWYSGEGYLVDADVSPNNGDMIAVTLTELGSRIVSFSLNSESERGSFISADQLVFDIEYLTDKSICAVSEAGLTFLNNMAEHIADYNYSEEFLKDYSLDGSGFAVLLLGKYKAGGTSRLVTVDSNGNELGSLDVEGEFLSVSASGRYVAVVYTDKTVIYSSDLSEYGVLTESAGVKNALMCQDGTAIIISGYGAAIFTP